MRFGSKTLDIHPMSTVAKGHMHNISRLDRHSSSQHQVQLVGRPLLRMAVLVHMMGLVPLFRKFPSVDPSCHQTVPKYQLQIDVMYNIMNYRWL